MLGQVTDKTEQLPGGSVDLCEYRYDERGCLEEVLKNGVIVEAYAYNANGSRMSVFSLKYDLYPGDLGHKY